MIDRARESIFPLTKATAMVRKAGAKLHVGVLVRWATRGVVGVRLEVLRIHGRLWTSAEAIRRFSDRLAAAGREARQS